MSASLRRNCLWTSCVRKTIDQQTGMRSSGLAPEGDTASATQDTAVATTHGVKVAWRIMRKQSQPSASLGTFLGAPFQFIKQLGLAHCDHLHKHDTPNTFITVSVLRKAMWDLL
jgi:hypothetical protein